MRNRSIFIARLSSLLILGALVGIGITNVAFAHWRSAIYQLGIGGGFLVFFSAQWVWLDDTARQRRDQEPPAR
jgi:small neutral amino acid transporter SnatA (MarC family)